MRKLTNEDALKKFLAALNEKYFWESLFNDLEKFKSQLHSDVLNFARNNDGVFLRQHFNQFKKRTKGGD